MFIIDLKSRVPIYEQLKNSTLELIHNGILKADDPMPSVRALARELGVNPNTIQKAYQDMERDEIIYAISGRGSFVKANTEENSLRQTKVLEKLCDIAYETKLNGVDIETAINTVKTAYERGMKKL